MYNKQKQYNYIYNYISLYTATLRETASLIFSKLYIKGTNCCQPEGNPSNAPSLGVDWSFPRVLSRWGHTWTSTWRKRCIIVKYANNVSIYHFSKQKETGSWKLRSFQCAINLKFQESSAKDRWGVYLASTLAAFPTKKCPKLEFPSQEDQRVQTKVLTKTRDLTDAWSIHGCMPRP